MNMPPLTHGNRSEPIPTYELALHSVIYLQAHAPLQTQAAPSPPLCGQPEHAPAPATWCPEHLCTAWAVASLTRGGRQAAGQPAESHGGRQREPRWPACWGLPRACLSCNCCPSPPRTSHNPRSRRGKLWHLQDRCQMVVQLLLLIHRSTVNF